MSDISRIVLACDLAARRHAGQFRRGPGNVPYINHPIAVARLVAEAGADADTVIAAPLHDTVEDTPTTLGEVTLLFGPEVAGTVAALTTPAAWDDLPLAEKKARQAAHIRGASEAARLVKLADQASNLNDPAQTGTGWSTERLRIHAEGAGAIAAACNGLSEALGAAFRAASGRLGAFLRAAP